jgi:uncharacterized Zn finger protein
VNLNNFEDHIDTVILERGYDYYQDNFVLSLETVSENKYCAIVEGTDFYRVLVELDNQGEIIHTSCDCPYVYGEFCKHQVAVFYALRKEQKRGEQVGIGSSRKKDSDSFKKLLMAQDKAKLVGILLEIVEENEVLKKQIMFEAGQASDDDLVSNAVDLIRSCIDRFSDHFGFVHYDSTWDAISGAEQTLDKAVQVSEKGQQVLAVKLTLTVMREMLDVISKADDSDGCIGQLIDDAVNLLNEITVDETLGKDEKAEIYEMLISEVDYKSYAEWSDWQLDLLRCCSDLVEEEGLRKKLEQKLNALMADKTGDSWSIEYYEERVKLIKYYLIRRYEGKKQAMQFMLNNLHHSDFREMAIKQAFEEQDYERVIELTLDGEQQDNSFPGLVQKWREYRYQAYHMAKKIEELRELALQFILAGHFSYYESLKETYSQQEWPAVYPQIIALLEDRGINRQGIYTSILVAEGEKQKLLEHVQANPAHVVAFYKELIPPYEDEVFRLFVQHIEEMAANASNRGGYKKVCQVIRRLNKIGGREHAAAVKEKLLQLYKRRPAFCDELSRT